MKVKRVGQQKQTRSGQSDKLKMSSNPFKFQTSSIYQPELQQMNSELSSARSSKRSFEQFLGSKDKLLSEKSVTGWTSLMTDEFRLINCLCCVDHSLIKLFIYVQKEAVKFIILYGI
ncbi:Hypothetical_protein [Hexamita inflata]|uniref:Hypothetical_protein n=1 Tax=Hexamita inflata TaxID=28002 RepID=A0AA86VS60_9EUKA|nr:Hypothetical protein HINF_LOCUS63048 [Hexamita inflata]